MENIWVQSPIREVPLDVESYAGRFTSGNVLGVGKLLASLGNQYIIITSNTNESTSKIVFFDR